MISDHYQDYSHELRGSVSVCDIDINFIFNIINVFFLNFNSVFFVQQFFAKLINCLNVLNAKYFLSFQTFFVSSLKIFLIILFNK